MAKDKNQQADAEYRKKPKDPKTDVNKMTDEEKAELINTHTNDSSAGPLTAAKGKSLKIEEFNSMSIEELQEINRTTTLNAEELDALQGALKEKTGNTGKTGGYEPKQDVDVKNKGKIFEEKDIIDYMFKEWFIKSLDWAVNKSVVDPLIWAVTIGSDKLDRWGKESENVLKSKTKQTPEARFAAGMSKFIEEKQENVKKKTTPENRDAIIKALANNAPVSEDMLSSTATDMIMIQAQIINRVLQGDPEPANFGTESQREMLEEVINKAKSTGKTDDEIKKFMLENLVSRAISLDVNYETAYWTTTAAKITSEYEAGSAEYNDINWNDAKGVENKFAAVGAEIGDAMVEYVKEHAKEGTLDQAMKNLAEKSISGFDQVKTYSIDKKGKKHAIEPVFEDLGLDYNPRRNAVYSKLIEPVKDADGNVVSYSTGFSLRSVINKEGCERTIKSIKNQKKLFEDINRGVVNVKNGQVSGKGL